MGGDVKMKKRTRYVWTVLFAAVSLLFLLPALLTFTHAFMGAEELFEQYGGALELEQNGAYTDEAARFVWFPKNPTWSQFYTVLFQSPRYLVHFWNSVFLTVPIVIGQVAVAAMSAYSLARVRGRLRNAVFFFYVLLMLMPYQVTLVSNYLIADQLWILGTRWAILFPGIFSPFAVFLTARFMQRIPHVQLEAASLDGAGEWRLFTRICLPQCRGVLYAVAILVFIEYWNMLEQPLVLLDNADEYPLSVFLAEVNSRDTAVAFAAAVIYMLPPLLLFLHGEHHLTAGIAQADVSEVRRRRWVIWVAAVLLVALAVLTVLLPRWLDRLLPRVTVSNVGGERLQGVMYPSAVPYTAVYLDDDGYYVLVVEEEDSSFGSRCRVRRVGVTVLARDKQFTAVEGELTAWDRVVSSFSAMPHDGQYVREESEI